MSLLDEAIAELMVRQTTNFNLTHENIRLRALLEDANELIENACQQLVGWDCWDDSDGLDFDAQACYKCEFYHFCSDYTAYRDKCGEKEA